MCATEKATNRNKEATKKGQHNARLPLSFDGIWCVTCVLSPVSLAVFHRFYLSLCVCVSIFLGVFVLNFSLDLIESRPSGCRFSVSFFVVMR